MTKDFSILFTLEHSRHPLVRENIRYLLLKDYDGEGFTVQNSQRERMLVGPATLRSAWDTYAFKTKIPVMNAFAELYNSRGWEASENSTVGSTDGNGIVRANRFAAALVG